MMSSKPRPQPDDILFLKPRTKKHRIKIALHQQWMEREMKVFPQPDPPLYKPLG